MFDAFALSSSHRHGTSTLSSAHLLCCCCFMDGSARLLVNQKRKRNRIFEWMCVCLAQRSIIILSFLKTHSPVQRTPTITQRNKEWFFVSISICCCCCCLLLLVMQQSKVKRIHLCIWYSERVRNAVVEVIVMMKNMDTGTHRMIDTDSGEYSIP